MQFIWPIKADYRIVYLDDNYTKTVIGREARDYVWVMARTPDLSEQEFDEIEEFVDSIGYDVSRMNRVPHQWPDPTDSSSDQRKAL